VSIPEIKFGWISWNGTSLHISPNQFSYIGLIGLGFGQIGPPFLLETRKGKHEARSCACNSCAGAVLVLRRRRTGAPNFVYRRRPRRRFSSSGSFSAYIRCRFQAGLSPDFSPDSYASSPEASGRKFFSPGRQPWDTASVLGEAPKGRKKTVCFVRPSFALSGLQAFWPCPPRAYALGYGYFAPSALRLGRVEDRRGC